MFPDLEARMPGRARFSISVQIAPVPRTS